MASKINIKKLYKKLDRKLIDESILKLFNNQTNIIYAPKYQRNYVWNNTKSINLIETILINGEIPPLTVIKTNDTIEIIDGRQRIETIFMFRNNEFVLRQFGLDQLKDMDKKNYKNLPSNLRTIFDEYRLKMIVYTIKPGEIISQKELEYIKRSLFRKHNCGMTALNGSEIARAKYLYDPLTIYLTDKLENNQQLLDKCKLVLIPKSKRNLQNREIINLILVTIRELLTTPYIPIMKVNTVKLGNKVIDNYYQNFITGQNVKHCAEEFFTIFDKLYYLKQKMINDNYPLKDNILFIKSVYWMLDLVYKQYTPDYYNFSIDKFYNYIKNEGKALDYFENYNNIKSEHIINRHKYVRKYLELSLNKELNTKIDQYLNNIIDNKRQVIYKPNNKISKDEIWYGINKNEKLKTGQLTFTVSEIINLVKTNRFIIRDNYQREEVKSKIKASRIIESILLGIKIPPIYLILETGDDHLDRYTVIDGQQRLISILTFIGELILDGKKDIIKTYKHKYRLTGLKDLESLNGFVFDNDNEKINDSVLKDYRLNEMQKQTIFDYTIEAITIDTKTNPNFKPIDMFLRMNQSPCNISENSFEMWNSYDIIDTLDYVKKIAKYDLFKQYGTKMKEEELVVILAYMDYINLKIENIRDFLRVYLFTENKDKINERIEVKLSINNKQSITNYLEKIEPNSLEEKKFHKSLEAVEEFIDKLNHLISNKDELIKIFNPYLEVPRTGSMKDFYILWLILNNFDLHIIKTYHTSILKDLDKLFKLMKKMPLNKTEEYFIENMKALIDKYQKNLVNV